MVTERIKAEIKLIGKTQQEFCKEIGLNYRTFVSFIDKGQTDTNKLIIICKALGVSSDYILGLKDTK